MRVIKINETGTEDVIEEAVSVIKDGGIVSFPTETFYGLGVRYDNLKALKKLYEIKHRLNEKAIPLIIGDKEMLNLICSSISATAEKLMSKFWPGPLTLLLPAAVNLSEFITAGTGKVAVRIPGQSFALDLAKALEFPITATSANISGMPPADSPDDVIKYFGDRINLLVDGGKSQGEKPSTIVYITDKEIKIIRQGAVPPEDILKCAGIKQS